MEKDIELKAGEIMRKYRQYKYISWGIVLLDIIFLIYMVVFKMDYRISYIVGGFASLLLTVSVFALYAVIAAAAVFVKWIGALKIDQALYEDCDPFVYEACLNKLRTLFYKERFACLHAMSQYKLKGIYKLNYYIIMSAILFRRGEGMRAAELEQSYRARMKKNNKREQMYFRILCAGNNMYRAMENKDYQSAFKFLEQRKENEGGKTRKWTLIGFSMWEARICKAMGDVESARQRLNYVISEGGRLVYVTEAENLLREMNSIADGESENG